MLLVERSGFGLNELLGLGRSNTVAKVTTRERTKDEPDQRRRKWAFKEESANDHAEAKANDRAQSGRALLRRGNLTWRFGWILCSLDVHQDVSGGLCLFFVHCVRLHHKA